MSLLEFSFVHSSNIKISILYVDVHLFHRAALAPQFLFRFFILGPKMTTRGYFSSQVHPL